MTSPDAARELVARFLAIVNSHEFDRLGEVAADTYVQHNPHAEQGLDGLKNFFVKQLASMPDLTGRIERVVCEGDYVAAKTTITGSKDGKPSQSSIADFWRIEGGKFAEHW